MNFSYKIAKRFLMGGRSSGPSKLTGWMSILGLCIGSIAMILSISVLNGFEYRVIDKIVGFESDIRLTKIEDFNNTIDIVNKINGVKSAMPFQERKGLIIGKGGVQRMVTLKAIEIDKFASFYDIDSFAKSNYGNQPCLLYTSPSPRDS